MALFASGCIPATGFFSKGYATRSPATFDPTSGLKVILELRKFPWSFLGASNSLARATPVWKNRGLVTALHTTSSDRQNLDGSRE